MNFFPTGSTAKIAPTVSVSHDDMIGQIVTIMEDHGDLHENGNHWYQVRPAKGDDFAVMERELEMLPPATTEDAPPATTRITPIGPDLPPVATAAQVQSIIDADDAREIDSTIVDDVIGFINRYVILPTEDAALVLALWIIHTHVFEGAYATPYIYINSTEPGCGKTRLLEVLEYAARNATLTASLTSSTLYRQMLDPEYRPTMLIDEVDALFDGSKKNEDMRGVLNSGYQHKGYVMRTLPGKGEDDVVRMPTFCPKVLAGIDNGDLPETLKSRSLTITLRKKAPNQDTERFLPRRVEPIADALTEAITSWCADNVDTIHSYEPEFVEGIDDRQFQITEPLLQVAYAAGIEDRAREAVVRICETPLPPATRLQRVLLAARDHFATTGEDRVSTNTLMVKLDMTGKMVSTILADNGVKVMTLNKYADGKNAKGFYHRDLRDLMAAHLQGR